MAKITMEMGMLMVSMMRRQSLADDSTQSRQQKRKTRDFHSANLDGGGLPSEVSLRAGPGFSLIPAFIPTAAARGQERTLSLAVSEIQPSTDEIRI